MILNAKFRKKEKKLLTGLLLFFSSLGVSTYAAKTIPNLSNIVIVAPKHGGEEGTPFYANNVQLEPLSIYFCFSSTPPQDISLSNLSFYSMEGGSGEGAKHALTLNTNKENQDGFFLYDGTSKYYSIYNKMGFTLEGGVFTGRRSQLMQSNGVGDSGDTSACNGRNFIEKNVYIRAKKNLGVFNVLVAAQNDEGDTISSDAGANNYITVAPFNYTTNDFNTLVDDFGKWDALLNICTKKYCKRDKVGAKILSDKQWNGSLDYLFNINSKDSTEWNLQGYNSSHQNRSQHQYFSRVPLEGSAFTKTVISLTGYSNGKHHKLELMDEWWGVLTGIKNNGSAPSLISFTPLEAAITHDGKSGNLVCSNHKTSNHWSVENLWNISKVINHTTYESLRGGVGLPNIYVKDSSVFWVQAIIKHYNTGSQHKYSCSAIDKLSFVGYDRYGNEFTMSMTPKIGTTNATIESVTTVKPYL